MHVVDGVKQLVLCRRHRAEPGGALFEALDLRTELDLGVGDEGVRRRRVERAGDRMQVDLRGQRELLRGRRLRVENGSGFTLGETEVCEELQSRVRGDGLVERIA